MIVTVTLNPCIDHLMFVEKLVLHDTNRVSNVVRNPGGKGVNLSRFAHSLGAETVATGLLGGGPGAYVRQVLSFEGVAHRFVEIADETRINFCVDDCSGDPPTTFNEPGPNVTELELAQLYELLGTTAKNASWLAIGGSLPPHVPTSTVGELIAIGKVCGAKTSLDADGEALRVGLFAGPDFVKPNSREAERLLGRSVRSIRDATEAVIEIEDILNRARGPGATKPYVTLSRGEAGAVLRYDGCTYYGESPRIAVQSTVGSGDSMIAAMLWSIEMGRTPEDVLRWGIAAGTATAACAGSSLGDLDATLALLNAVSVSRDVRQAVS